MLIANPNNYSSKVVKGHYLYTRNQLTVFLEYHRKVYNEVIVYLRSYNRFKPMFPISPDLIDFNQIVQQCKNEIPNFKQTYLTASFEIPRNSKSEALLNVLYYASEALNCQYFWKTFSKMKAYLNGLPLSDSKKLLSLIKKSQRVHCSNYNIFILKGEQGYRIVKQECPRNPYLYEDPTKSQIDLVVPFNHNILFLDYLNEIEVYSLRLRDFLKWKNNGF